MRSSSGSATSAPGASVWGSGEIESRWPETAQAASEGSGGAGPPRDGGALRGLSDATDYFIITSGDSEVHVRAIADHLLEGMAEGGVQHSGVEGERAARWVLVDYIDLVVHVFHPVVREFYQLERLWGDAPMALIEDPGPR